MMLSVICIPKLEKDACFTHRRKTYAPNRRTALDVTVTMAEGEAEAIRDGDGTPQ